MTKTEFEESVAKAFDELPPFILEKMDNVELLIQPQPNRRDLDAAGVAAGHTLLGLYNGIPLTRRSSNYALVPPDTITLFQHPIEMAARSEPRIVELIRHTIIHEIAHHFGISDDRLRELGAY